jgi:hypothetical protein
MRYTDLSFNRVKFIVGPTRGLKHDWGIFRLFSGLFYAIFNKLEEEFDMTQQKIRAIGDYGSRPLRVLDMLTPINGVGAPAVNAKYLGQLYVDETPAGKAIYISIAVDSVAPADDWMEIAAAV